MSNIPVSHTILLKMGMLTVLLLNISIVPLISGTGKNIRMSIDVFPIMTVIISGTSGRMRMLIGLLLMMNIAPLLSGTGKNMRMLILIDLFGLYLIVNIVPLTYETGKRMGI